MRALITGTEGFVGSHLAEYLLSVDDEVYGTVYERSNAWRLAHLLDDITLRVGDLANPHFIRSILQEIPIDVIYHLGGLTFVPEANARPSLAYRVNLMGSIHLLDAVRSISSKIKVVLISSAEVYGKVDPDKLPVKEDHPIAPRNVTAAAKAALELAARPYIDLHGLHIVIARPFNHTGPRQTTSFVCSNFAEQISMVENIKRPVIRVGNLNAVRDFTDVRDMVRAYRLLAEKGGSGEVYNLASGVGYNIGEILQMLLRLARVDAEIIEDPKRMRPLEVKEVRGDFSKAERETGWKHEIPFETTLRDLLNYHRDRLHRRKSIATVSHLTRILKAGASLRLEK